MGQKKIVIIRVVREKNREGVRKNSIVIAIRFLVPFGSAMLLRREMSKGACFARTILLIQLIIVVVTFCFTGDH